MMYAGGGASSVMAGGRAGARGVDFSPAVHMEHVYGQSQGLETTFESGKYVPSYHPTITLITLSY